MIACKWVAWGAEILGFSCSGVRLHPLVTASLSPGTILKPGMLFQRFKSVFTHRICARCYQRIAPLDDVMCFSALIRVPDFAATLECFT